MNIFLWRYLKIGLLFFVFAPVTAGEDRTIDVIKFETEYLMLCVTPNDLQPGDYFWCSGNKGQVSNNICGNTLNKVRSCTTLNVGIVSKPNAPKAIDNNEQYWREAVNKLYALHGDAIEQQIMKQLRDADTKDTEIEPQTDEFIRFIFGDSPAP